MYAILQREFFTLLKTPQALFIQLGVAVMLSVMVLLAYPSGGVASEVGRQSEFVFRFCGYGMLAAVLLIVPAFPSTGIVKEKSSGTLQLLLNSPLHPVAIYFGKFFGVALFLLLLLTFSLPATLTCYSMGGISLWGEIVPMYAILCIAAILFIAVGILISTLSQTSDSALRYTYFAAFAISFLTIVPSFFLQGQSGSGATFASWLKIVSPFTAMTELMGHRDLGARVAGSQQNGIRDFLIAGGVLSIILIAINIFILSQRIFDLSRSAGKVTDDQSLAKRVGRRIFFLVDPSRRKKGIGAFTNPVFMKEFRTRKFGRSHWLLRLLAMCAVGSIALAYFATSSTHNWGPSAIAGIMVMLQISLIILIVPSLASGLISSELESGGWNLLMLTPMHPIRIVTGKLLSVLWIVILLLASTFPGYIVLAWAIDPSLKPQVWRVIVTLLLASFLTISISAMISSFFKKSAVSTAVSYVTTVLLFGGTMLIWMGADQIFGYPLVRSALLANPVSGALEAFQTTGFQQYQLLPMNWWVTIAATVVCLIVFVVRVAFLVRPR